MFIVYVCLPWMEHIPAVDVVTGSFGCSWQVPIPLVPQDAGHGPCGAWHGLSWSTGHWPHEQRRSNLAPRPLGGTQLEDVLKTFVVGSLVVKVQVPAVTDVKGHGPCCPCCPWQLTFKATGLAFWRRSYRSNQGPAQANVLSFVLKRHEMSTQIRSNQHESGFTTSLGLCVYIYYIMFLAGPLQSVEVEK